MRPQTFVWIEIANEDMDTAEYCFQGKRFLWTIFMCQQAVEKAIKAIYFERTGETPPKKHDLTSLAGSAGILNECSKEIRDLFRRLSLYYIETRYPDKKTDLEKKCTPEYTAQMLDRSKEALEWLKSKLT